MKIELTLEGAKKFTNALEKLSEQGMKDAIAGALNNIAFTARREGSREVLATIDRPTPYTTRGFNVVPAKGTDVRPAAYVGVDVETVQDIAGNTIRFRESLPGETNRGAYLGDLEQGTRRTKRVERKLQLLGYMPAGWHIVPGQKAKIDAYGNQSAGEIEQALSGVRAASVLSGASQNKGKKAFKATKATNRKYGVDYFVVPVGAKGANGKGRNNLIPGIYRTKTGGLGRRIEPIIIFVKSANYRRYFDFGAIVNRIYDRDIAREVRRRIVAEFNKAGGA